MAAVQWETGTKAPDFRIKKGAKVPDVLKVRLLTSDVAVNTVAPNGRWVETPTDEPVLDENGDPVLDGEGNPVTRSVLVGAWEKPTEVRWLVEARRDLPDFASLIGKRMVWPQRLPKVPVGQFFVDVAPPEVRGKKPSWRSFMVEQQNPEIDLDGNPVLDANGDPVLGEPYMVQSGEWVFPAAKAIIDDQGKVLNLALSLDPADTPVPAGGTILDDPAQYEGEDEAGDILPLDIGDEVTLDQGAVTAVIKKARRFPRHSLRIVKRVLQARGQLQSFIAFAAAAGVTTDDLEDIGEIGLNTKLFRDWLASEGFTVKQAYQVIEAEIKAEKARLEALKADQQL